MPGLNDIERGDLCQIGIESLYEAAGGLRQFPGLLKKIIRERAWERRATRGKVVELGSLRELITEKPIRGWGEDPAKVEAIIRDDPEALAMYREAMLGTPGRPKLQEESVYNVHGLERPSGNSRARSLAVVQGKCDAATVDAVMKGRMSANAALVSAGLREIRTVYLPRDPAKALDKIRKAMGDEYVRAMIQAATPKTRRAR